MKSTKGLGLEGGPLRSLLSGLLLGAICLALAATPAAGASGGDYPGAVDRALAVVREGGPDPDVVAGRALAALDRGAAGSQPEIEADLEARPPRLADAAARLQALSEALRNPAFTPSPRHADQALRQILAQPRYAGLHPSLLEQLRDGALHFIAALIQRILAHASGAPGWSIWVLVGLAGLVLLGAAVLLVRALWWAPGRQAPAAAPSPELARRAEERFAEADRLAAAGDFAGATRLLASAVAAALGEDRDWETSPLTVRELFGRSRHPAALDPLLAAFELSVYGGHAPVRDVYRQAAAAAAPFRRAGRNRGETAA
jgi:hypothetical protein